MKARYGSPWSVQEAGGDVERVDGLRSELFEVERALFLRNELALARVDQRLVDSAFFVPVPLHTFVRHLAQQRQSGESLLLNRRTFCGDRLAMNRRKCGSNMPHPIARQHKMLLKEAQTCFSNADYSTTLGVWVTIHIVILSYSWFSFFP